MNKQLKRNGDKTVKSRGIEWATHTWNPIGGCFHACEWRMPDGTLANCYAEDVATRVAGAAYPEGFEHHYWKPALLKEPERVKTPSRIFVGSMADVFGYWVPEDQIRQVLDVCRRAPWHTFQFLTKNPRRVSSFVADIPKNCWIGASTPPDFMWNHQLTEKQRGQWLDTTIKALGELRNLGFTTWLSAEPITIDVSQHLWGDMLQDPSKEPAVDWMVIGAASNGKKQYAPDENLVRRAVDFNQRYGIATFFKGNLRSLPWAAEHWLEEFPESNQGEEQTTS